jgi:hypothetical protein
MNAYQKYKLNYIKNVIKNPFIQIYAVFVSISFLVVILFTISYRNSNKIQKITCTVLHKYEQVSMERDGSNMIYYVSTDSGMFVCQSSPINKVYNHVEMYYNLEEGKKYNFTVSGTHNTWYSNYRTILKFEKHTL